MLPFNLIIYIISSAIGLVARLFGVRPNLASFSLRPLSSSPNRILDPRAAAEHFVRELEEETGNSTSYSSVATGVQVGSSSSSQPIASTSRGTSSSNRNALPDFHIGSYESALSLAKSRLQPLCVVLTSSEHDDARAFNKQTLCDPDLISTFCSRDFVVWGGDVKYKDAYQSELGSL